MAFKSQHAHENSKLPSTLHFFSQKLSFECFSVQLHNYSSTTYSKHEVLQLCMYTDPWATIMNIQNHQFHCGNMKHFEKVVGGIAVHGPAKSWDSNHSFTLDCANVTCGSLLWRLHFSKLSILPSGCRLKAGCTGVHGLSQSYWRWFGEASILIDSTLK